MFKNSKRIFQDEIEELFQKSLKNLKEQKVMESILGFSQVLKMNPKYYRAHFNRGISFYLAGKTNEALLDFSMSSIEPEIKNLSIYQRSKCYLNLNEFHKAYIDIQNIIEKEPKKGSYYELRGDILMNKGEYELSLKDYNYCLSINYDNNGIVHLKKGIVFSNLKKWNEALENFDYSLDVQPKLIEAYIEKGIVYINLGKYKEALEEANNAINYDKNSIKGYKLREQIYRLLGEHQVAENDKEIYEKLRKDLPNFMKK